MTPKRSAPAARAAAPTRALLPALMLVLLLAAFLRLWKIDSPVGGFHAFNEAFYVLIAKNFFHSSLLAPSPDGHGIPASFSAPGDPRGAVPGQPLREHPATTGGRRVRLELVRAAQQVPHVPQCPDTTRLPTLNGWASGWLVVAWAARFTLQVRPMHCQPIDRAWRRRALAAPA